MTKLSPYAKSALDKVKDKNSALKVARESIMTELNLILDQRLESFVAERNLAVKLADDAGVPRTQIGKALGTTNYRTVQEILDQSGASISYSVESEDGSWSVANVEEGLLLTIKRFGSGSVSGSAVVSITSTGDLEIVEGDSFVIPQIYRAGLVEEIVTASKK
jgi:hypothetical protein